MKASISKSVNKGCFGGSMPGKIKQLKVSHTHTGGAVYKKVKATPMHNGTVGTRLVRKWLKRKVNS